MIGRSLHRRDELIDLWTAAYRGAVIPKIRETSFAGDIASWSPPPGWQVSGESAIETLRQPQTLTIYVKNFDPIVAIQNGWHKSNDPNIEIRRKFWDEPAWATAPEQYGAFTESAAPPLMVCADLLASREPRQSDVAALRRDQLVDPHRIGTQSLGLVDRVVNALVSNSGATDTSIMIIGAHCRDLLHASFGRTDLLRSTSDVDIGVAVDGDAEYQRIVRHFPAQSFLMQECCDCRAATRCGFLHRPATPR